MLEVTIYSEEALDGDPENETQPLVLEDVKFVSLVDAGTHGPPALVAPGRDSGRPTVPAARPGDRVVYINTSKVPVFEIERRDD